MSKIVVFGAAGKAGYRVVSEASARGHAVIAVARDTAQLGLFPGGVSAVSGDATYYESVAVLAKDADVLVLTIGGPDPALYPAAVATVIRAVRALGPAGPRILHMGGGASLLNEYGTRFVDAPGFGAELKPEAMGQLRALDAYRASEGVTWTYLSPPPVHFAPGQRTGRYRAGLEHPVTGADGQARISYEDYAVALVDEIEIAGYLNRRFTVGY